MSRKIENQCVDCGLPCLGNSCPYRNVPVDYCDDCGDEGAEYRLDNEDLCKECAEERIRQSFDELSLLEQADALNISLSRIDD